MSQIDLAQFVSVLCHLTAECGKIIREVHQSGVLKQMEKSDESPVTIADLKVQKTIEQCLKHFYPDLKVEGEESAESIAEIESVIDPTTIS